jgi:hypothetical protein
VTGVTGLTGGQPITATATFTDNGPVAVRQVSLDVRGSVGYAVTATSQTQFAQVAAGQTVRATFQVVPPNPTALFSSGTVTATTSYTWLGVRPITTSTDYPLTISAPVQPPLRTFTSSTTGRFAQVGSKLGIQGDGADTYGGTNQYGVTYLAGAETDGTVATAEITAQQNTNAWAKAGIMVRNDVTNAKASPGFLILAEAPGHGYVMQWDANGDGQLDSNSAPSGEGLGTATYPTWLKLVRSGTTFTGYYSTDDVTWTLIDTVSLQTAAVSQDVGVFMTAHNAGTVGEVDFDHFAATGS